MQRYFVIGENWHKDTITLDDKSDIHHIKNVMRMNVGDNIICTNPEGKSATCSINLIDATTIQVGILHFIDNDRELPIHVTIAQALPKLKKLELILQKGTELGCTEFCLYQADRSIAQWDEKKGKQKMNRYEKIVKEASEQCERNRIPQIHSPISLESLLKNNENYDIMLFAYEEEAKTRTYSSLNTILKSCQKGNRIFICIGPEGGFSESEVALLKKYQVKPVRLGPRILRTETASMYVLSSVSYHFEEMGCK